MIQGRPVRRIRAEALLAPLVSQQQRPSIRAVNDQRPSGQVVARPDGARRSLKKPQDSFADLKDPQVVFFRWSALRRHARYQAQTDQLHPLHSYGHRNSPASHYVHTALTLVRCGPRIVTRTGSASRGNRVTSRPASVAASRLTSKPTSQVLTVRRSQERGKPRRASPLH